jgi:hypothetical protein
LEQFGNGRENFVLDFCGISRMQMLENAVAFTKSASANPRPLKLFSAALQLSLEIVLLEKNQQNH